MEAGKIIQFIIRFFLYLVKIFGWKKVVFGAKYFVFCVIWSYGVLAMILDIIHRIGFGKNSIISGSYAAGWAEWAGNSLWFTGKKIP